MVVKVTWVQGLVCQVAAMYLVYRRRVAGVATPAATLRHTPLNALIMIREYVQQEGMAAQNPSFSFWGHFGHFRPFEQCTVDHLHLFDFFLLLHLYLQ